MYQSHFEMVYNQITEGIQIKVAHQENNLMMSEIIFQKGAVFPEHIHFTDHSGYCMQGKIRIIKNGIVQDFVKGDSWCIGKNICHSTEAIEESMVIELFKADDEIHLSTNAT